MSRKKVVAYMDTNGYVYTEEEVGLYIGAVGNIKDIEMLVEDEDSSNNTTAVDTVLKLKASGISVDDIIKLKIAGGI